jgi:hypothetical protein
LVFERLPSYRAQIPASVKMDVMLDRSVSIRESVKDVQMTLTIPEAAEGLFHAVFAHHGRPWRTEALPPCHQYWKEGPQAVEQMPDHA